MVEVKRTTRAQDGKYGWSRPGRRGRGQSSGEKDQRARPTEIERLMLRSQTDVKSRVIVWVRLCSNRVERMRWTKFERIRLVEIDRCYKG